LKILNLLVLRIHKGYTTVFPAAWVC